jgi:SAM-dependent methyltransferase
MVTGAWRTKVIAEVARLGIPDLVAVSGPLTAEQMVQSHGVLAEPGALERLLRAAASLGLLTESSDGQFGPTDLSSVLTSDSPDSVKELVELIGGLWFSFYGEFGEAVRTGQPQVRNVLGMEWWAYVKEHPEALAQFGEAMRANGLGSERGTIEMCDMDGVRELVDVGGGFGSLARKLVRLHAGLNATVFDVPHVIAEARARLAPADETISSRLKFVEGDMFESVPAADMFVLWHILHDWDDAACERILRNCGQGLRPQGRVIAVVAVLPPFGDTSGAAGKLVDTLMLVAFNGRERRRDEWSALFGKAGFRVRTVTPIPESFASIVEAVRA